MADQTLLQKLRELLENYIFTLHKGIVTLGMLEVHEPLFEQAWAHFSLDDIAEELTADPRSPYIISYDSDLKAFVAEAPPTL